MKNNKNEHKGGYIIKTKSESKITENELKLINKLTRRNLTADEVYTFTVILCDNDIDRDNERFTNEALEKLAKLYVGKTGILDHNPTSGNQTARIYECHTEIVKEKTNRLNEPYKRLVAKAYMPISAKNENIILEIDSGIKKEVSVGCTVEDKICSICGKNLNKEICNHIKGRKYKKNNTYQICHTILDNPTDAYEWSFVAIPAQKEAGVIKALTLAQNGGEIYLEEIIKNLKSGQSVTFTEQEASKLFDLIKNLKEKAEVGSFYKEELKKEVIKLSAIVQPEISLTLMKSVTEKLNVEELKSFRDSFKSKLSEIIPTKPQFSQEKTDFSKTTNTQFKI